MKKKTEGIKKGWHLVSETNLRQIYVAGWKDSFRLLATKDETKKLIKLFNEFVEVHEEDDIILNFRDVSRFYNEQKHCFGDIY